MKVYECSCGWRGGIAGLGEELQCPQCENDEESMDYHYE